MRGDGRPRDFNRSRQETTRRREFKWATGGQSALERVNRRLEEAKWVTYFVSNLPTGWGLGRLKAEFEKINPVKDLFVASKLDKHGFRFGFLKFDPSIEVVATGNNLRKMVLDGFQLFAHFAQFDRNGARIQKSGGDATKIEKENVARPKIWVRLDANSGKVDPSVSFADKLQRKPVPDEKNKKPTDSKQPESKPLEAEENRDEQDPWISLKSSDFKGETTQMDNRLIGKVKHLKALTGIRNVLIGEGYGENIVDYLGDLWVLLSFKNLEEKKKFKADVYTNSSFDKVEEWNPNFQIEERIVWLEIDGIPLHVFCQNVFISIARLWGEVLKTDLEKMGGCNLSTGRVCISTDCKELIWDTTNIEVDNKTFTLRVREERFNPWNCSGVYQSLRNKKETELEEGEIQETEYESSDGEEEEDESDSECEFVEETASFLNGFKDDEDRENEVESRLSNSFPTHEQETGNVETQGQDQSKCHNNLDDTNGIRETEEGHTESTANSINEEDGATTEGLKATASFDKGLKIDLNPMVSDKTQILVGENLQTGASSSLTILHSTEGNKMGVDSNQAPENNCWEEGSSETFIEDTREREVQSMAEKENDHYTPKVKAASEDLEAVPCTPEDKTQTNKGSFSNVGAVSPTNASALHSSPESGLKGTDSNMENSCQKRENCFSNDAHLQNSHSAPKKNTTLDAEGLEAIEVEFHHQEGTGLESEEKVETMLNSPVSSKKKIEGSREENSQGLNSPSAEVVLCSFEEGIHIERTEETGMLNQNVSEDNDGNNDLCGDNVKPGADSSFSGTPFDSATEDTGYGHEGQFVDSYLENQLKQGKGLGSQTTQTPDNCDKGKGHKEDGLYLESNPENLQPDQGLGFQIAQTSDTFMLIQEGNKEKSGINVLCGDCLKPGALPSEVLETSKSDADIKTQAVISSPVKGRVGTVPKKKRKGRFRDPISSPIRTRSSRNLQSSKTSAEQGDGYGEGYPELKDSVRLLRKKDRESKGLKISYPGRSYVQMDGKEDRSEDFDLEEIGRLCGFTKQK